MPHSGADGTKKKRKRSLLAANFFFLLSPLVSA